MGNYPAGPDLRRRDLSPSVSSQKTRPSTPRCERIGDAESRALHAFLFPQRVSICRARDPARSGYQARAHARRKRSVLREARGGKEDSGVSSTGRVPRDGGESVARVRRRKRPAAMGNAPSAQTVFKSFKQAFDKLFGNKEMRVVMLGLDAAGKTTILYKLHISEVLSTVPTLGFNVEKVQYKNVVFTVWDVGGQEKLRPLWRHYFNNTDGLIFVVDCLDRDRVQRAKEEFYSIINDAFMKNSAILIFANKQDLRGAMTTSEIVEAFDLPNLRGRRWHVQASCATQGLGLYEGLDWLSSTLTKMRRLGILTSVGQSGEKHGQGRQGRAAAFT